MCKGREPSARLSAYTLQVYSEDLRDFLSIILLFGFFCQNLIEDLPCYCRETHCNRVPPTISLHFPYSLTGFIKGHQIELSTARRGYRSSGQTKRICIIAFCPVSAYNIVSDQKAIPTYDDQGTADNKAALCALDWKSSTKPTVYSSKVC